jgi:hypothetical protein
MANSNGWGDGAANNAIGWGQGANNNIGWGKSHSLSSAGLTDIVGLTTDSDAQAFITAAAITDATQQSAIDTLVKGLKTDGIWTKMKAIYPFVGGTASTHKYNLKDPRDLDAAFRLVFNGGWTHSSTGATPNGTNGYADTKLNIIGLSSLHYSYYSRTTNTTGREIGVEIQTGAWDLILSLAGNIYNRFGSSAITLANADSQGFYIGTESTSLSHKLFKNGSQIGTTQAYGGSYPSKEIYLGAINTTGGATYFSAKQTAFSTIGDGLTDTEATALNSRIQNFQTALSRQV